MCDIDLNFLESNNKYVIMSLVDIEDEKSVPREFTWYPGKKNKSYGAFVKSIGSSDKTGLKGYILPKVTKLKFTKSEESSDSNSTYLPNTTT